MNSNYPLGGLASLVASRGGGDDSMLVHMTPSEVQGLQSLAMAHGGSLEINPETGLPKAGFLKSILPTVLGAVLAPFTGGLSAALLVGAGTGLVEKDWKKGLLAGLGAFGGAGLSSALTSTGSKALETAAAEGIKKTAETAATTTFNPLTAGAQQLASSAVPQGIKFGAGESALAGLKALGSEAGREVFTKAVPEAFNKAIPGIGGMIGTKTAAAAAAAPMLFAEPEPLKVPKSGPTMYYTGTEFEQELNPNRDQPGQAYFTQRFTPGQFTTQMPLGMAEGGKAESNKGEGSKTPPPTMEEYYRSMLTPPPRTAPANPALGQYLGDLNKFITAGTPKTSPTYVAPPAAPPPTTPPPAPPPPPTTPPPGGGTTNPPPGGGRGGGDRTGPDPQDLYNFNNFQGFDPSVLAGFDPSFMQGINPFVTGYTSGSETYNPQTQKFEPTQTAQQTTTPDLGGGNDYASLFGQQFGREFNAGPFKFDTSDIYNRIAENELMDMNPGMMQFNQGGISTLGGYSDGGRLLRGPGDGMSDDIPAEIRSRARRQPARLADGEFVVPADVVSHLGNGSTDAGAKQLYKMMDKVRRARTKTSRQAKAIKPEKYIPGRRS